MGTFNYCSYQLLQGGTEKIAQIVPCYYFCRQIFFIIWRR